MENQTLGENSVKFKNLFELLQSCKTNKENTAIRKDGIKVNKVNKDM